jgi:hypothetical protein
MSRSERSIEEIRRRVRAMLEESSGKPSRAQRGCCRVEFDGGKEEFENVTRKQCRDAAKEFGGVAKFKQGGC